MKVIAGIGGSGMLLGSLYATDALTAGQVYDVPVQQAYNELASMPVPNALVQAMTGTGATSVTMQPSAGTIDWQFQVRGQVVAVLTVRLTAEGEGRTRVRTEYTPGTATHPELRHLASAKLIRDLARVAMNEQIEAQLERRPIDQDEIVDALARHAAAHPEQVREFERAAGEMVAGMYRQANETGGQVTDRAAQ